MTNQTLIDRAVQEFGTTDNPKKAGFILPDGRLLDFNRDRIFGRDPLFHEHKDIAAAYFPDIKPANDETVQKFTRETGSIRFHPSLSFQPTALVIIDKPSKPTQAQLDIIDHLSGHGIEKLSLMTPDGMTRDSFFTNEVKPSDRVKYFAQATPINKAQEIMREFHQ